MAELVRGHRAGGFVLFQDEDGLRHAVRAAGVLALSDGDQDGGLTIMQMPGNRALVIRRSLDEVLSWFH